MDDLEGVAFRHPNLAERRARHDREVALDRDLSGVEPDSLSISAMVTPTVTRRGSPLTWMARLSFNSMARGIGARPSERKPLCEG